MASLFRLLRSDQRTVRTRNAWVAGVGLILVGIWASNRASSQWSAIWSGLGTLSRTFPASTNAGQGGPNITLGQSDVVDVAIDGSARLWLRISRGPGAASTFVVLDRNGAVRRYGSLREAIVSDPAGLQSAGTLPGFWAVQVGGSASLWAGASRYDWLTWHEPDLGAITGLVFDDAAMLDGKGRAWVPFTQKSDCPMGATCVNRGLAVISQAGAIEDAFSWPAAVSGSDESAISWWHMVITEAGPLIVANAAVFRLDTGEKVVIGPLDATLHPDRLGGRVIAAERATDGALVLWCRLERSDSRTGELNQVFMKLTWKGGQWTEDDWTQAVVRPDDARQLEPISAAATAPSGTIWFGTAQGVVLQMPANGAAVRWDASNSPIDAAVRRITPDGDSVWVATMAGLHRYGPDGAWSRRALTYLPSLWRAADRVDTSNMIFIGGSAFQMGAAPSDTEAEPDEMPLHSVTLGAFWIDRTEVTGAAWNARGVDRRDVALDLPVTNVSWEAAQVFCASQNKRLPTEAEWERTARGTSPRRFPWSDERTGPELANVTGDADGFTGLAPVGSFPAGASPDGALDMAGNVWEWVADWYAPEWYVVSPEYNPRGPAVGQVHVVRGGSWMDGWRFQRTSDRGWNVSDADQTEDRIGFRCAYTP